jgi:hypothetical protein
MRLFSLTLALLLVIGTSGCALYSVEGRYSYDSATDFSVIKSFAWKNVDEDTFATPKNNAHFRIAMASALSAKGFTENQESPDFVIGTEPVKSYREMFKLYEGGEVEFEHKILRVNFIHPSSGKHIYEGVASAYNNPDWSQEEINAIIDEVVEVVLRQFPPGQ